MSQIGNNLLSVKTTLPEDVTLVAVSKYHPNSDLMDAYHQGQRIFGESIVQELRHKQETMPSDIQWHFIGHLQTNKVKYIAPYVSLVHAVDSLKLMQEISKQALKNNRVIDCLLQIHVAQEETKFGFTPEECRQMLRDGEWKKCEGVNICGLMCMATNTDNELRIRQDFKAARNLFNEIKAEFFATTPEFSIRSYGMSDDYPLAIEEGSNMVRVGTRIFGSRKY